MLSATPLRGNIQRRRGKRHDELLSDVSTVWSELTEDAYLFSPPLESEPLFLFPYDDQVYYFVSSSLI